MKRWSVLIALVGASAAGFLLLGSSRSAEGPAQGGQAVHAAAREEKPRSSAQAVPVTPVVVSRGDMQQSLEISGSLKADEDVQIGSRIAGKVVRVTVKEGDRVKQGQVLVQLDERELRAQMAGAQGAIAAARAKLSLARNQASWKDTSARSEHQRALAALDTAKTRLQQAETEAKLIDVETRKKVESAQSGVRVATERLSIAKELTRKQELRQAELAIVEARALVEQAKVDAQNAGQVLERRQTLFQKDAIAKEEVDEAERQHKAELAELKVAEARLAASQQQLELANEGSRPEEVRIAQGQLAAAERALEIAVSDERRRDLAKDNVEAARAALRQAEAAVQATEAGLVQSKLSEDEIGSARAALAEAEADLALYRTQLEDLTIRAPVSGVVSVRQVHAGEMVTTSSNLMTLVALDTVYVEAQVPELEVSMLRSNAPASVTVDSLPGKKFSGVVREVIPVADRDSRSFRVRIAVLGGGKELPVGGFARANVRVGRHQAALLVDKAAVQTESGDRFVWLIAPVEEGEGWVARRQLIKTGLVDDRHAEVLSGLEEGQKVIASGSPAIIEGTPLSLPGE
ncbi:MAG: efflux RND transporter periplasmic adaptor subunit [Armatimonadota bacterium]